MNSTHNSILPIGGFFGLAINDIPPSRGSIWVEWTRCYGAVSKFGTGRGALIALIGALVPRRIWLPAYYCGEVATAIIAAAANIGAEIHNFGLDSELEPDVSSLNNRLVAGDVVVVVDYFGWPPSEKFRDLARDRTDVVWVEDRAQTLWTKDAPWGTWCIYSPRKLLGAAHGGLLLGSGAISDLEDNLRAPTDLAVALPELMRFEDQTERHNDQWYAAYKEREHGLGDRSGPMSRLAKSLLRRIPIGPLVRARQANYRYLLGRLSRLAPWPRSAENVAPFGLPIIVEDSLTISRKLAEERLFCPRHWPDLGSNPSLFPYEHALSRQLLTLPCDHRYSVEQLGRLADAIDRLAPNPAIVQTLDHEKYDRDNA